MSPHWNDDELIGLLYGLGNTAHHVAGCAECQDRLKVMGKARAAAVDAPHISGRMLAVQRQQILERLEKPASVSRAWRWAPVATAASLLAAGLVFHQRPSVPQQAPPAPVTVNAEADAELFTDVYSMEQDVEPRAAAPIRALFQETALEKEGR